MDEYLVQLYKLCRYVTDSHSAGCLVVFSNMEMYANEDLCSFCQLNVWCLSGMMVSKIAVSSDSEDGAPSCMIYDTVKPFLSLMRPCIL